MAVEQQATKGKRRTGLTPVQRLIVAYLRDNADVHGWTTLSKAQLADNVECSLKTVDRAMKRLKNEGYIEVKFHYAEDGGSMANSYRLKKG